MRTAFETIVIVFVFVCIHGNIRHLQLITSYIHTYIVPLMDNHSCTYTHTYIHYRTISLVLCLYCTMCRDNKVTRKKGTAGEFNFSTSRFFIFLLFLYRKRTLSIRSEDFISDDEYDLDLSPRKLRSYLAIIK